MVKQIKFELCNQENGKTKVLATEYLNIDTISDYRNKGMLPFLRKSHIDMYTLSADRSYFKSIFNMSNLIDQFELRNNPSGSIHRDINLERDSTPMAVDGKNEQGVYVARVLLDIQSNELNESNVVNKDEQNNNSNIEETKDFVAYAILSDVTKINKKYTNSLSFRLCVGKLLINQYKRTFYH